MVMNYDTYEIASRIRKYYEIEEEKATSHACVRFGIVCVRCGCILHISVMVSKCKHQIENYATKNMEKYTHTHTRFASFSPALLFSFRIHFNSHHIPYLFQCPCYLAAPFLGAHNISFRWHGTKQTFTLWLRAMNKIPSLRNSQRTIKLIANQ